MNWDRAFHNSVVLVRVPLRHGGPLLPMQFTVITLTRIDDADHPETAFIDCDAAVVPLKTRRPMHNYPTRHPSVPGEISIALDRLRTNRGRPTGLLRRLRAAQTLNSF